MDLLLVSTNRSVINPIFAQGPHMTLVEDL